MAFYWSLSFLNLTLKNYTFYALFKTLSYYLCFLVMRLVFVCACCVVQLFYIVFPCRLHLRNSSGKSKCSFISYFYVNASLILLKVASLLVARPSVTTCVTNVAPLRHVTVLHLAVFLVITDIAQHNFILKLKVMSVVKRI